jgi:hypothetical protein
MEEILINIDSKYRDINIYPNENKFRLNLDINYKNIISAKLSSMELNHSIQFLNYKNISSSKGNNYFTIHIPNKLNDPDGTKITIIDGYTRTIDILKDNINQQLNIFNKNFNNNEKYSYIFYLVQPVPILNLSIGWYSLYGLYNIIKSLQIFINFDLHIFDRRFPENVRIDTINLSLSTVNSLKNDLYNIYKSIFDLLRLNYNSIYAINSTNSLINSNIFNLVFNFDHQSFITDFSNLIVNLFSYNIITNTWIPIQSTIYDIISFDIDFYNLSLQTITNLNYPSLGYFLGFRPNLILKNFLISSIYNENNTKIISNYPFNLTDNSYLFLKVNDWGHIKFLNTEFFAKISFNSYFNCNKIDEYVNPEFKFRQPINFQKLDIELIDYLGNNIDINGRDFSFTIKLIQILNTEEKNKTERTNLFFTESLKK